MHCLLLTRAIVDRCLLLLLLQATRHNLGRPIAELVALEEGKSFAVLTVNDKKLHAPLRMRLSYTADTVMS